MGWTDERTKLTPTDLGINEGRIIPGPIKDVGTFNLAPTTMN